MKVDDRGNHSQKALSVSHRITDQKDGAGSFTFADYERLPVVNAAIARCGVGTFQLAVQESVRRDASGGNAFGVSVEERGVSDLIRGRYEVLQQGTQFRGLNVGLANVAAAGHLDRRRQIGLHHPQRAFVLSEIVRQ